MKNTVVETLWERIAKTGIKTIDDEHRVFIDIINEATDFIKSNPNSLTNLRNTFVGLIEYAHTHFKTEEDLMFKFKFERYDEHKKLHWSFIKEVINLSFDYAENKPNVSEKVTSFLENWLVEHIIQEDVKFIKCFKENGVE